jgi:hypothetical protein
MKLPTWLPSAVLFIGVTLLTVNLWITLYKAKMIGHEGFVSAEVQRITSEIISDATKDPEEKPPTDLQAAQAYRSLLLYIKSDFTKGLLFVYDMNKRIYGRAATVPDSFDPRKVMDDYKNPLTGL